MEFDSEYAVRIIDAGKCYRQSGKEVQVFQNVNLNLRKGQIYGLLGASGCGKTSLFRCILGTLKVDAGKILVFGCKQNFQTTRGGPSVGYMPQDTSVYENLTIAECLRYYGAILGLSDKTINFRIEYFINLLNLPTADVTNSKLSGGQLRRVSFAIALFHEPKLLILDEPLVGVDPIVKNCMWQHLVQLCQNNDSSILLATHYIEEARRAHMVGMMHAGTLVVEDSMTELSKCFKCNHLEDIFLKICSGVHNDESCSNKPDEKMPISNHQNESKSGVCKQNVCQAGLVNDLTMRWHPIKAICKKNFLNLYRFQGACFFAIFLPCLQVLIASYAFGSPISGIDMQVMNEDNGSFGNLYLSHLDPKTLHQKAVIGDSADSRQIVIKGETYAALHIGPNFTESLMKRVFHFPLIDKLVLERSKMNLFMADSSYFLNKRAQLEVWESYQFFLDDLLHRYGQANFSSSKPVIYFNEETIKQFKQPGSVLFISGLLLMPAYFAASAVTLLIFFKEISGGHLERSFIAGVTSAELLSALLLLQSIICLFQNAGILAAALYTLVSINKGSLLLIFCFLYLQGVGGMMFGLLLSLTCSRVIALMICGSLFLVLAGVISGMFWPIEAMPCLLRYLCMALPLALPLRALDRIIRSGWGLFHAEVALGFAVSTVWVVMFLALSLYFHFKKWPRK